MKSRRSSEQQGAICDFQTRISIVFNIRFILVSFLIIDEVSAGVNTAGFGQT